MPCRGTLSASRVEGRYTKSICCSSPQGFPYEPARVFPPPLCGVRVLEDFEARHHLNPVGALVFVFRSARN